jgi:hypothetical protein
MKGQHVLEKQLGKIRIAGLRINVLQDHPNCEIGESRRK